VALSPRPDLPGREQSRLLADWLEGPRGRLLRRANIGKRRRVLEVGCGHGVLTQELQRRANGPVVGIDRDILPALAARMPEDLLCQGDIAALPFRDLSFDLAVCENVLLWVEEIDQAANELRRVLKRGGVVVVIEPDYGGMMEYPETIALRDLWIEGLRRAGADPLVGRRLPGVFERAGFSVWLELQGIPQPATPQATGLLAGLPLSAEEQARVSRVAEELRKQDGTWTTFVHVPYFLLVCTRGK